MGKRKLTAHQRAGRRYWNDVRAIAKIRETDILHARKYYRAAIDMIGAERSEVNREAIIELAAAAALDSIVIFEDSEGEYYFSFRENVGQSVSNKILPVMLSEFSIDVVFVFTNVVGEEERIENTLFIPASEGRKLNDWWSSYYSVGREWLKELFEDDSPDGSLVVYKIEAYPG